MHIYKLYGSNGFFQNGKFTSYKNIHTDNILVFLVDKIQIIFINLIINNKIEYFDFLDMIKKTIKCTFTKNIKINIKRKSNEKKNMDEILIISDESEDLISEESDTESDKK